MRLLITRPPHENDALAQILSDLGHDILQEPLLSTTYLPQTKIETENPQAIIVTSANGARAFATHVEADRFKNTPVFAVGQATADALDQFNVVHVGDHGVAAVEKAIRRQLEPDAGPLLYVRGVHVAGNLADDLAGFGYKVDQVILYEMIEKENFSSPTIKAFQDATIEGVLLFSPRTAEVFSKLVRKANLVEDMAGVTFYCLSRNVSDSIELGANPARNQIIIAKTPTLKSLISLVKTQ